VSAGHSFSTALTADGDLYAWGKNDQAQLGIGTNVVMDMNTMEEYPVKVEFGGGAQPTPASHPGLPVLVCMSARGRVCRFFCWRARNPEPRVFIDCMPARCCAAPCVCLPV
jgi:hypothetical protein